jgi:hypothetical protein
MTIKEAKLEVSKIGMVLSKTEHGEFRVNFKGGSEATAYYTNDLDDAVGTARAMKKQQPQGSHATAGITAGGHQDMMSYSHSDIKDMVEFYKDQGVTAESITSEDIAGYLGISKNSAVRLLPKVKQLLEKSHGPMSSRSLVSMVNRFASSQVLDRISDHLEALRQEMPREASNLRGLALRLDRVANTLEAEQEATDRVFKIESELDGLGVEFTVAPNSSDKQATCIYAYKGQLGSREEASVLGRIAKKHGSTLENGNRAYKITVPHHV